jgi:hypothetical protein
VSAVAEGAYVPSRLQGAGVVRRHRPAPPRPGAARQEGQNHGGGPGALRLAASNEQHGLLQDSRRAKEQEGTGGAS